MTVPVRLPPSNGRLRLGSMSVLTALDWAFRRENVQLELPQREVPEERGSGFGMEYVLLQRARLGTQVDESRGCWGGSTPHPDAEVIAAIVSKIPDGYGGLHMAIRLSEYARSGLRPDPMVGVVPKVEPAEWVTPNRHGRKGRSDAIGSLTYPHKGRMVSFEVRWCPIVWRPEARTIASARAFYIEWWMALRYVRRTLQESGMLREVTITNDLPKGKPWDDA